MPNPTRADTWLHVVSVNNQSLGIFDTFSGAEADSEETKYRPGGMDQELSLGGRRTYGNLTVSRYWDIYRDGPLVKWLYNAVGQARGFCGRQAMTAQGQAVGDVMWFHGTLKRVSVPDIDSMGTDAALFELEFTIDQVS